jgi:hypothetical protein
MSRAPADRRKQIVLRHRLFCIGARYTLCAQWAVAQTGAGKQPEQGKHLEAAAARAFGPARRAVVVD